MATSCEETKKNKKKKSEYSPLKINTVWVVFFKFVTDRVGGGAEDLHQDVLIGARSLHGLPQLLHGVDDGRVQHGEDGLLESPRQLALQLVRQLLSQMAGFG